jgi:hypothetical protein
MARQFDSLEDRLEELESGEHRAQFDSRIRSLIGGTGDQTPSHRTGAEEQVGRLLSLMEDLARRMDVIDRKNRNLSAELRHRDRLDRRRRHAIAAAAALFVLLGVGGWAGARMNTPAISSTALD